MKNSAINPEEPLSGETILLDSNGSSSIAKRVIESSRKLYAYDYSETKESMKTPQTEQTTPSKVTDEDEPLEV